MKIALLRVGIDTGSGGIHGPLFQDGSFEYIPIPDGLNQDNRTYGNTVGRYGKRLVEYFPGKRREEVTDQPIHCDPEFTTFTYGDPTSPKARLRHLKPGDLLLFYCGLQGYGFESSPALYLMGYFSVLIAGWANDFSAQTLDSLFSENYHVKHRAVFEQQRDKLVLVKGDEQSRLLNKAVCISEMGKDRTGKPLKVLSGEMQKIFGDFGGKISIQRSPPRWISPANVPRTAEFVRSLERS